MASPNEATPLKASMTVHPAPTQIIAIGCVQMLNAADWAVILPIDVLLSDFVVGPHGSPALKSTFAALLVAAVYLPFPVALYIFGKLKGYKRIYGFWGVVTVLGNGLFALVLITRPANLWAWLFAARLIQGFGQSISFANLQVLALTTSHDVRTMYKSVMNACNQTGYALGISICATVLAYTPPTAMLGQVPLRLVLGPLAIVVIASVTSLLFVLLHPDAIDEVDASKRHIQGPVSLGATTGCVRACLGDGNTRRVRVLSLAFLGFLRASVRVAFLTVSVHILVDTWRVDRVHSCVMLACMTLTSVASQVSISYAQFRNPRFLPDEVAIVVYELVTVPMTLAIFSYGAEFTEPGRWRFIICSSLWMCGMALSSAAIGSNLTKYADDTDPWFHTANVTRLQMLSEQCLGKALGPIFGMAAFRLGGYDSYVWYQLANALLMVLVAHSFVVPWETASDCCTSRGGPIKAV